MKKFFKIIFKILVSIIGIIILFVAFWMFDSYLDQDKMKSKYSTIWEDDVYNKPEKLKIGKGELSNLKKIPNIKDYNERKIDITNVTEIEFSEFQEQIQSITVKSIETKDE